MIATGNLITLGWLIEMKATFKKLQLSGRKSIMNWFSSAASLNRKTYVVANTFYKICFLIFFAGSIFNACRKDNLETPEPIKQLIAQNTDCTCEPFIDQYKWRSKIIYLQSCGGPACDCITNYFDEKGKEFKMNAGYTPDNFREEAHLLKNVWTCR